MSEPVEVPAVPPNIRLYRTWSGQVMEIDVLRCEGMTFEVIPNETTPEGNVMLGRRVFVRGGKLWIQLNDP